MQENLCFKFLKNLFLGNFLVDFFLYWLLFVMLLPLNFENKILNSTVHFTLILSFLSFSGMYSTLFGTDFIEKFSRALCHIILKWLRKPLCSVACHNKAKFFLKSNFIKIFLGSSMSSPNNFNHQTYQWNLPILWFMVRNFTKFASTFHGWKFEWYSWISNKQGSFLIVFPNVFPPSTYFFI